MKISPSNNEKGIFYDIYVVEEAVVYLSTLTINFTRQIIKHKKHQYFKENLKIKNPNFVQHAKTLL